MPHPTGQPTPIPMAKEHWDDVIPVGNTGLTPAMVACMMALSNCCPSVFKINGCYSFHRDPSANPSEILPQNPSADPSVNVYFALKILPRNPSAKILPRRSASKEIVYFFGSFRSIPQNPSAKPFHKCLFCIENPSAGSFRKILPQK